MFLGSKAPGFVGILCTNYNKQQNMFPINVPYKCHDKDTDAYTAGTPSRSSLTIINSLVLSPTQPLNFPPCRSCLLIHYTFISL